MFRKILIVCVGNVCRSPMAAGLFAHNLAAHKEIIIDSAGLHALVGESAVSEAQIIMHNASIDISRHRAKQLQEAMIVASDLILVMEKIHKQQIESLSPVARGRVYLLGEWSNFEILDPYMQPMQAFDECYQLLQKAYSDWAKRVN